MKTKIEKRMATLKSLEERLDALYQRYDLRLANLIAEINQCDGNIDRIKAVLEKYGVK